MTISNPYRGAVCASVFGALALFVASVVLPSQASAAVALAGAANLGNLSKATSTWDPARGGSFSGQLRGDNGEKPILRMATSGALGSTTETFKAKHGWSYNPLWGVNNYSDTFEANYKFSLDRTSDLSWNMNYGKDSTRFPWHLTVILRGPDNFQQEINLPTFQNTSWSNVWSNLKAGDYVLTFGGEYGSQVQGVYHNFSGNFAVTGASPGDVPLPAAVVLLGTALAGAGAWGRKKRKTAPIGG